MRFCKHMLAIVSKHMHTGISKMEALVDESNQSKGGKARKESLTPERRSEIAKAAAAKRWAPGNFASALEPTTPFAKHAGTLELGGSDLDVYVLSNGTRVISLNKVVKAITRKDGGNLGEYLGVSSLKPFIDKDLVLGESYEFEVPGTQFRGRGITAESFLTICQGYVAALQAGALHTERQREIAIQCSIVLSSCAKIGLIALIDEATGYQYERAEDALQIKLRAFISEELRAWEKTFPDELWEEFGRLTNWTGPLHSRPKWWGKLVTELIYDTLDTDVAKYLKQNKPPAGIRWFQNLTENYGARKLVSRCYEVIGMAKSCRTMADLRAAVAQHYGKKSVQLTLYLPKDEPVQD
jgi:hypothetical protein